MGRDIIRHLTIHSAMRTECNTTSAGVSIQKLTVPEDLRHFPFVQAIDAMSEALEAIDVIAATNGGVGYKGHIAYHEPPSSSWYRHRGGVREFRDAHTESG